MFPALSFTLTSTLSFTFSLSFTLGVVLGLFWSCSISSILLSSFSIFLFLFSSLLFIIAPPSLLSRFYLASVSLHIKKNHPVAWDGSMVLINNDEKQRYASRHSISLKFYAIEQPVYDNPTPAETDARQ